MVPIFKKLRLGAAIAGFALLGACGGGQNNETEICDDNRDNDADGQIDCLDPDCAGAAACQQGVEVCNNNADDDADGQIDCADPDCATAQNCQTNNPFCGDGFANGTEQCDGTDLRGQSCQSLGFDDGALVCAASCTLDTSGCFNAACGNGTAEAGEDCDGADLAGQSCQTRGFASGTLACAANCDFDTSGCADTICGDGVIAGLESCDDSNTTPGDGCDAACQLEAATAWISAQPINNQQPAGAQFSVFFQGNINQNIGGANVAGFGVFLVSSDDPDICQTITENGGINGLIDGLLDTSGPRAITGQTVLLQLFIPGASGVAPGVFQGTGTGAADTRVDSGFAVVDAQGNALADTICAFRSVTDANNNQLCLGTSQLTITAINAATLVGSYSGAQTVDLAQGVVLNPTVGLTGSFTASFCPGFF